MTTYGTFEKVKIDSESDLQNTVKETLEKIDSSESFFESFLNYNKRIIDRMGLDIKTLKIIKYTAAGIAIISLICFVVFLEISLPVAAVFGGVVLLGAGCKVLCDVIVKRMKKKVRKSYESVVELL